ncbi:MipA/OmpV family protein [soil metagenome]
MRTILRSIPALAVLALIAAVPAKAQETTASPDAPLSTVTDAELSKDTIMIGIGGATVPTYEGSAHNHFIPVGLARGTIGGISFQTQGTQLFVNVVPSSAGPGYKFEFGPVVGANFARTVKKSGDARVDLLGKKKVAGEIGAYVGFGKTGLITSDFDTLSASVAYVHDVTGVSDSYVVTPQIVYGTPLSRKAYVRISADASYAGGRYADTYFGIDTAGALRSGLPRYNPGKGWKDWSVAALGNYALTGDLLGGLSAIVGVSYSHVLGDFARSPIVAVAGDKNQWYGAVGLAYTF